MLHCAAGMAPQYCNTVHDELNNLAVFTSSAVVLPRRAHIPSKVMLANSAIDTLVLAYRRQFSVFF